MQMYRFKIPPDVYGLMEEIQSATGSWIAEYKSQNSLSSYGLAIEVRRIESPSSGRFLGGLAKHLVTVNRSGLDNTTGFFNDNFYTHLSLNFKLPGRGRIYRHDLIDDVSEQDSF